MFIPSVFHVADFLSHTCDVFPGPRTSLDKVMFFIVQFLIKKINLVQNLWGLVDTSRILLLLVGLFFTEK